MIVVTVCKLYQIMVKDDSKQNVRLSIYIYVPDEIRIFVLTEMRKPLMKLATERVVDQVHNSS